MPTQDQRRSSAPKSNSAKGAGNPAQAAPAPGVTPGTRPAAEPVQARYAISVVAGLVGTGQQNIRLYETRGLLTPHRTPGGTRQYSDGDVAVLLRIAELLEAGLNLAGVAKVLELEAVNATLRSDLERARRRRQRAADTA